MHAHFYDACKHINGQYELWLTDDKQFNEMIILAHIRGLQFNVHHFKHVRTYNTEL